MVPLLVNRQARRDYTILEEFEAGVVLLGAEVKSLRGKRGSIHEAFVKILHDEAFLVNANIQPYQGNAHYSYDPTHSRKLLLKKRQIAQIDALTSTKGLTAIPLIIGLSGNYIKVLIGVGKGKKQYERKEELKRRDLDKETKKALKNLNK